MQFLKKVNFQETLLSTMNLTGKWKGHRTWDQGPIGNSEPELFEFTLDQDGERIYGEAEVKDGQEIICTKRIEGTCIGKKVVFQEVTEAYTLTVTTDNGIEEINMPESKPIDHMGYYFEEEQILKGDWEHYTKKKMLLFSVNELLGSGTWEVRRVDA